MGQMDDGMPGAEANTITCLNKPLELACHGKVTPCHANTWHYMRWSLLA